MYISLARISHIFSHILFNASEIVHDCTIGHQHIKSGKQTTLRAEIFFRKRGNGAASYDAAAKQITSQP